MKRLTWVLTATSVLFFYNINNAYSKDRINKHSDKELHLLGSTFEESIRFNTENLLPCEPGSATLTLFNMTSLNSVRKLANERCELTMKTSSIKLICELSKTDRVAYAKEAIKVATKQLAFLQTSGSVRLSTKDTPIANNILNNGSCRF